MTPPLVVGIDGLASQGIAGECVPVPANSQVEDETHNDGNKDEACSNGAQTDPAVANRLRQQISKGRAERTGQNVGDPKRQNSVCLEKVISSGILIMANLVLMAAGTVSVMLIGSALWGLHMGATQGLLTAFVADAAPRRLRGTAIGFYNLVTGVALLIASTIAGVLWTGIGPATTFLFGAGFATVALLILPFAVPKRR